MAAEFSKSLALWVLLLFGFVGCVLQDLIGLHLEHQ